MHQTEGIHTGNRWCMSFVFFTDILTLLLKTLAFHFQISYNKQASFCRDVRVAEGA